MRIFFFLFKKILRKGTRIINAYSWVGLKICRHIQIRNRLAPGCEDICRPGSFFCLFLGKMPTGFTGPDA